MARIARLVVPGIPHHVTQRGNRRQQTFFFDEDYQEYIRLLSASCKQTGVEIWAYCFMPNHVHIIAVPEKPNSLRAALAESHRRYTRMINFRHGWRGHLWQERFASYPMDEKHLLAAARYVELNPVKAKLTVEPEAYGWSSARSHIEARDDALVRVRPLLELVGDWKKFLSLGIEGQEQRIFQKHERTGRPLGDDSFVERLEGMVNRLLRKQKPGPKKQNE